MRHYHAMTNRRLLLTSAPRRGSLGFWAIFVVGSVSLFGSLCGCSSKETQPETKPSAEASPPQATAAPVPAKSPTPVYLEPIGPELIVAPGRGISAIRFGTNFETLARHMEGPCDVRTETRCVYIAQAVDFTMKDGVVVGMKIHRKDRHVPGLPERVFGIFKGMMPPSIQFGLHRHIVAEEIKMKPERVENISDGGVDGLVAREHYPGVIVEYDRLPNGNVVAASFEVVPLAPSAGSPAP